MEVILVTLSQLFANNLEQFKVPAYQRRYSWNTDQIEELFNDIVSQNDHLLGMLILFRVNFDLKIIMFLFLMWLTFIAIKNFTTTG